jgi:hypothetical protein
LSVSLLSACGSTATRSTTAPSTTFARFNQLNEHVDAAETVAGQFACITEQS